MKMTLTAYSLTTFDPSIWDGFTVPEGVDRQNVIDAILSETLELPLIYPDANLMRQKLPIWNKTRIEAWGRIAKALSAEYSPIENFDRYEEYNDNKNGHGENLSKVNAFNDGLQDSTSGEGNTHETIAHNGHLHGNIGVTTNQQMITAEIELRKNDVINLIVDEFKTEFCIRVW